MGVGKVETFIPKMGRAYTNERNYDFGAKQHRNVLMLSPFIRHRLVMEQYVIAHALQMHGAYGA